MYQQLVQTSNEWFIVSSPFVHQVWRSANRTALPSVSVIEVLSISTLFGSPSRLTMHRYTLTNDCIQR
jgi:hypothetical protein